MHTQAFKLNSSTRTLQVRQDATGRYYSRLDDIQEQLGFQGSVWLEVDGVRILPLLTTKDEPFMPLRFEHHPEKTIEIILRDTPPPLVTSGISPNLSDTMLAMKISSPRSSSSSSDLSPSSSSLLDNEKDVYLLDQKVSFIRQTVEHAVHLQKVHHRELMEQHAQSKERDERLRIAQQQANDRLVTIQRNTEAILVQNYELHEYPIPRLFVILPVHEHEGTMASQISQHFTRKFRLHFLCECGEHSEHTTGTTASSSSVQNLLEKQQQHANRLHLTHHEGYEISRPTKFFEQYGRYMLGLLQILRYCAVPASAVVSPLSHAKVVDILDGISRTVKTTSVRNPIDAIDASIDFLGNELNIDKEKDDATAGMSATSFMGLDALEGADLRRLETFLRKNDGDKVLGDLYRITTSKGHVKWVCASHFKGQYNSSAVKKLLQTVEVLNGHYNPRLGKVTVVLPSPTVASDFYRQLKQGPAVDELEVSLAWKFKPGELSRIALCVQQAKVRVLSLNFEREWMVESNGGGLFGKERYHALEDILKDGQLQTLRLRGMWLISSRMTGMKDTTLASLRCLHYSGSIFENDQTMLSSILLACSQLTELRLWGDRKTKTFPNLVRAVSSLSKLRVLHLVAMAGDIKEPCTKLFARLSTVARSFRELIIHGGYYDSNDLLEVMKAFSSQLEVYIVDTASYAPLRLSSSVEDALTTLDTKHDRSFSRLCKLRVHSPRNEDDYHDLVAFLPHLDLTNFAAIWEPHKHCPYSRGILHKVNFATLQSLELFNIEDGGFEFLWEALQRKEGGKGIVDTLTLSRVQLDTIQAPLAQVSLRRLRLDFTEDVSDLSLSHLVSTLDFSRLETLVFWTRGFGPMCCRGIEARRKNGELLEGFRLFVFHTEATVAYHDLQSECPKHYRMVKSWGNSVRLQFEFMGMEL